MNNLRPNDILLFKMMDSIMGEYITATGRLMKIKSLRHFNLYLDRVVEVNSKVGKGNICQSIFFNEKDLSYITNNAQINEKLIIKNFGQLNVTLVNDEYPGKEDFEEKYPEYLI